MLGCLFNRAWQTYAHSMLCICDAVGTTLLLYERTKEVDAYYSFVSLRMQCLHCKFFCCDGHVAVQAEACLCMDWRMDIICILMFFCLYYLFATCFVFLKNAVLALQILCMMDMWQDRQKLAYAWTGGWTSSAFLCSFVLMSLLHVCIRLRVRKY